MLCYLSNCFDSNNNQEHDMGSDAFTFESIVINHVILFGVSNKIEIKYINLNLDFLGAKLRLVSIRVTLLYYSNRLLSHPRPCPVSAAAANAQCAALHASQLWVIYGLLLRKTLLLNRRVYLAGVILRYTLFILGNDLRGTNF